MSKRKKLYNLRHEISIEIERVCVLLDHLIFLEQGELKNQVLSEIAFEKATKISKMNEKIGIILKH